MQGIKKSRASKVDKILQTLKHIHASKNYEELGEFIEKIEKRPKREPTAFNLFVRETMKELKTDVTVGTKDKMKECSRRWKLQKEAVS